MSSMTAAKVSLVHCRNLTVRSTFRRISTAAMAKSRTRIHRLIEEQGVVLMPGCFDALSAVVTQQSGFSAGFVSGSAVSAALLGKPDIGLLTPPETAATAKTVCAAAPGIPFIVDADTGGGNALNVHRTIKDLIAAGAAGCFLEDQAWPKKCGHMLGKKVIPAEEHAAKIASARAAIGDADFFLVARTDARSTSIEHGLEEAISRANLYMEAGADGVFMAGPKGDDDLKEFGRRVKGFKACTMIEGGITPLHTSEELKKMGFHLVVYPFSPLYASARAMLDVCKTLKEKGTTKDCLNKMTTFGEFNNLVGLESWNELEARFAHFKK